MVGAPPTMPPIRASKSKSKNGIDVVLGAQWGDEGKGKLVDLLSQVCCPCSMYAHTHVKDETCFSLWEFMRQLHWQNVKNPFLHVLLSLN